MRKPTVSSARAASLSGARARATAAVPGAAAPGIATPAPADTRKATLQITLVCALFLMMIMPPNLNYGALVAIASGSTQDQNITSKLVLISVLIGSCYTILRRQMLWVAELRSLNLFYLAFLALAALSLTWSIAPDRTLLSLFRLAVTFLCFTAFTLNDWRSDRFSSLMRSLLGAVVVGSVIFAVVLPHYGVQQFSDFAVAQVGRITSYTAALGKIKPVLRGLTFGKNQMGQLASLGLILWVHAWLGKEVRTRWMILCGGASLIGLYWAHSSTSILAAAFSLPILLMLRHWPPGLRRFMPYILGTFATVILLYSLVVLKLIPQLDFLLTPITALTGKDLTFSDRTAIWQIVIQHITLHPLLGTGYAAYWVESDPRSPSNIFRELLFFWPGESHNGYLEVINDLGIVGALCLLGFLFTYLRQALQIMKFNRHQGSLFVVLLFHQFWSSLSESHWFSAGSVSFTVITLAVCSSGRMLLQHRFELSAAVNVARAPARAPARTPEKTGMAKLRRY